MVGDGAVVVALGAVRDAAVGVSVGVFGIEPDRLVVVGDGAVEVAFDKVRDATIVIGKGELGIEPNSVAVVGDGAVEVVLGLLREAAIVIGDGVFGIGRKASAASACVRGSSIAIAPNRRYRAQLRASSRLVFCTV
jgi:hypothetical protein